MKPAKYEIFNSVESCKKKMPKIDEISMMLKSA